MGKKLIRPFLTGRGNWPFLFVRGSKELKLSVEGVIGLSE
jgi:hypothetical protein